MSIESSTAKTAPPAITLMVVCGIGALLQIVSLGLNVLGIGAGAMARGDEAFINMFSGGIGIVFNVLALLSAGFVIFGANKMRNLESYGLSMAAVIVGMVPCISPCCYLGIPVGIWALVVLLDEQVKRDFQDAATGGMTNWGG